MTGVIAVDIAEILRQDLQRRFYSPAGIGYVFCTDNNFFRFFQGAVTGTAFGITR